MTKHEMILRQLFFILIFKECVGLKDVRTVIPSTVEEGNNAELFCLFDLEGDPLYVVKWYRNGREFFRYIPKEKPPTKIFPLKTINILEQLSDMNRIVLTDLTLESGGYFNCEISVEAPSFFTSSAGGTLEVIDVPKDNPIIKGLKKYYSLNETLKADCIAPKFRSPIQLLWTINDQPVDPVHLKKHKNHLANSGFYNVRIGLRLLINNQLFVNNQAKVSCTINIHNIYTRKVEQTIFLIDNDLTTSVSVWEDSLPAERIPITTMILTTNANNKERIVPSVLLFLLYIIIMWQWQ